MTKSNERASNESLVISSRTTSGAAGNKSALTYRIGLAFEILSDNLRSGAKWRTLPPSIRGHTSARSKYIKRCLSRSWAPHRGQEKFLTFLPITSSALIKGGTPLHAPRYGKNRP